MPGESKGLQIGNIGNIVPTPSAAPTEKALRSNSIGRSMPKIDPEAQAKKAATDFEALLLQQMLDAMSKNIPSGGLVSGSKDEQTYRDMYNQALAKDISEHQSIGVRDAIMRDFKELHKKYNPSGS